MTTTNDVQRAKRQLDDARATGDELTVQLAEAAMNDALDRLDVTLVTRNTSKGD